MSLMAFIAVLLATGALFTSVQAEQHTIIFTNNCGFGTPTLRLNNSTLSTGQSVTFNGPVIDAIAFLQTGSCGANGEGCTLVETTLRNPTTPGSGSVTEIIPGAAVGNVGFGYFGGCDGAGIDCTPTLCSPLLPGQPIEASCDADNVNLAITFCD